MEVSSQVADQPKTIFHITTEAEWQRAATSGSVTAPSLLAEGFIHCSEARHLPFVLGEFFALAHDLTLLYIDPNKVTPAPIYEGSDKFPHIYGTIPLAAVTRAVKLHRAPTDNWVSTMKRECPGVLP